MEPMEGFEPSADRLRNCSPSIRGSPAFFLLFLGRENLGQLSVPEFHPFPVFCVDWSIVHAGGAGLSAPDVLSLCGIQFRKVVLLSDSDSAQVKIFWPNYDIVELLEKQVRLIVLSTVVSAKDSPPAMRGLTGATHRILSEN
jgi:hypothetical protein